jgi:hypothetical protein
MAFSSMLSAPFAPFAPLALLTLGMLPAPGMLLLEEEGKKQYDARQPSGTSQAAYQMSVSVICRMKPANSGAEKKGPA